MFERLARLLLRSPRKAVLWTLLVAFLAGGAASGLQQRLTMGGYESTGTESHRVAEALDKQFHQGEPNLVLVLEDKRGVDDAAVTKAGTDLTGKIAEEADVTGVVSYWTSGKSKVLRGEKGDKALLLGRITGDFDSVIDRVKELDEKYTGTVDGIQVHTGGNAMMWAENTAQSAEDATKAESLVFPIVLVVLVVIFGSAVVALLPLAVAIGAMMLSMGFLFVVTLFADTSNMVVNTTTFLGIGLGIDYCLLFVTRYREELRLGKSTDDAITTTLRTAGRTVLFSALTVAVAFIGLLTLPFTVLRSLAVGCMTTAVLAALSTIVLAPALLKWIGPRIDKWRLIRRKDTGPAKEGEGFWHNLAGAVMRRPIRVTLGVLIVVVALGLPALHMNMRLPDESVLPTDAKSAQVAEVVKSDFDTREQQALQVVTGSIGTPADRSDDLGGYAQKLSALPDVARVDTLTGSYAKGAMIAKPTDASAQYATKDAAYLSVVPSVDPLSDRGEDVVRAVRGADAPFSVEVGGPAAVSVDTFDMLKDRLPLAGLVLFIGMFVLLFLLTGSILLPIKAMVLTTLSLTATFGALVFIFQDGHLKGLIGDFIVTGGITWTVPVMSFGLAFALSMDYEVFMLSRIREEYDRLGDNEQSVALGLERVGKVVTYAAILLSLVFLVLLTSGISYMKALGLGMALAVLMDATLIRGGLLPALMKLMGRANWWAPGPLRRFHARFGLRENAAEPAGTTPATEEPVPTGQR